MKNNNLEKYIFTRLGLFGVYRVPRNSFSDIVFLSELIFNLNKEKFLQRQLIKISVPTFFSSLIFVFLVFLAKIIPGFFCLTKATKKVV